MSARGDVELEEWRREWQSSARPAPIDAGGLGGHVSRGTRRLILLTAAEVAFTILGIGLAAWKLRRQPNAPTAVWAGMVCVFFAAVWICALSNRRGVWKASGESVRDFLALAKERCRRRISAARFAGALLLAEVLFLIPWGWWEYHSDPAAFANRWELYLTRYALIGAAAAASLLFIRSFRRRARRELQALERLERECDPN